MEESILKEKFKSKSNKKITGRPMVGGIIQDDAIEAWKSVMKQVG